jgi:hypothetical protein
MDKHKGGNPNWLQAATSSPPRLEDLGIALDGRRTDLVLLSQTLSGRLSIILRDRLTMPSRLLHVVALPPQITLLFQFRGAAKT